MSAFQMSRFHDISVTVFWNRHLEVSWHASDKTFSKLLSRFGVNVIQGDLKETRHPVIFLFRPSLRLFFPFSILFVQNTKFAPISTFRFVSPRRSCRRPRAETTAPDRLTKKRTGEEYVVKYVVKNVGVNTRNFQLPALLLIVRDTV